MAEGKPGTGGDHFLFAQTDSSPTTPSDHPEPKDKPLVSKPARSFTPRGQRFSKLSDAYLNITSRLGPNKAFHKALEQSQSTPAGPALLPVASPRLAQSQDDLQTSGSAVAMRAFVRRSRCASLESTDLPEDLQSGTGSSDNSVANINKQIDHELSKLNAVSHDNTSSTIDRIVAQYDDRISSLKVEYDNTREYRVKTELPISQPPEDSLPESPPTNMRPTSNVRQSEYDSPVPDSSITDSQYLLDAEAQAHALEQARRAVVPLPLKIAQTRHEPEISGQQHYGALNNDDTTVAYEGEFCAANPFAHPDDERYELERDVSLELRRFSGYVGHGAGQSYSPSANNHRQTQPQGKTFCQPSPPTTSTGEKQIRHIKVVIGRQSDTCMNSQENHSEQTDDKNDNRDLLSEDGDWVTEATSDVGFGASAGALPGRPLTGGLKKAGSSLADYSDEGYEDVLDRFGSSERIIQHPAGDDQYQTYDSERANGPSLSALLSRRQNAFPQGSGLHWASTTEEETGQFRPQILPKNRHPYREIGKGRAPSSGRLVFNFDHNAPPRYEFRDSVSEYEPAVASTKATCGTQQYDTRGSLPSAVTDFGEENYQTTIDAHFDQSVDLDVDQNHSSSSMQQKQACQTGLIIYEADNQELEDNQEFEEFDNREFAVASYYAPLSANSVKSKFDFELLPLDQAQQKNKLQRDSGKTNETESTAARLKRKQSFRSSEAKTNSLEPPPRAFIVSSNLSMNFSSPEWQPQSLDLEDTPTRFATGRSERTTSGGSRRHRKFSSLGTTDNSGSFKTRSVERHLRYSLNDRYPLPTLNPRPFFIAPDDYVSDRAATIRRSCFYILAILSILPFVGVLVLSGAFSECLKWATEGEVDRLTSRQRRFIKWMLYIETVLYTGGVVAVVVYFAMKQNA
ncbi:hypothetical protein F5Y09DRAFT_353295 [Xylaria sp. FL1042]|nr:hypothetical protein F5Y09DRAFT_353295 [Xylaria sp. FL1042]